MTESKVELKSLLMKVKEEGEKTGLKLNIQKNEDQGILSITSWQSVYSVAFDSLHPRGLNHARPPCPSPTPGVYSNLFSLSHWCHPTIPSSLGPFSSCLQPFPASGSSPVSQFFTSGGQSIGVSASASVLPVNSGLISFRMDWLYLLAVQGTLKSLLQNHSSEVSILRCSAFFIVQLSYPYMTTGKNHSFD